jgi:glycosyltransferase 2 family protein
VTEPISPAPARARPVVWVLRALIAIVPLVWVMTRVNWRAALSSVRDVSALTFTTAMLLLAGSMLLGTIRWRFLLFGFGASPPPPLHALVSLNLIATYFNLLPGGIAGDAVRGYEVRARVGGIATSYAVLLVERLAGFAGLAAIASAVMLTGEMRVASMMDLRVVAIALLALSAVAIAVPAYLPRYPAVMAHVQRIPLAGKQLAQLQPMKRVSMIPVAFALSLGTQMLTMVAMVLLVRSAHPSADFAACLHVAPLVVLLIFVPITPGAIGQREALFVHFFGQAGVPAAPAVAASLLWFAAMLIFAAVGGVCLLFKRLAA